MSAVDPKKGICLFPSLTDLTAAAPLGRDSNVYFSLKIFLRKGVKAARLHRFSCLIVGSTGIFL